MNKVAKGILLGSIITAVGGIIIAAKCKKKKELEEEQEDNIGVIKYNDVDEV